MMEFLNMGGYAFFVWGSYLVVAVCMVGMYLFSRRSLHSAKQIAATRTRTPRNKVRVRASKE